MRRVLLAWIGNADLIGPDGDPAHGEGPIAQVLAAFPFDEARFLCNYPRDRAERYLAWLAERSPVPTAIRYVELSSPTDLREIYRAASDECRAALAGPLAATPESGDAPGDAQRPGSVPPGVSPRAASHDPPGVPPRTPRHDPLGVSPRNTELTLHLSPGTPAMHAVWILLGTTRYPARFVEASRERGPREVSIPFDIAADFIPEFWKEADKKLIERAAGEAPVHAAFDDIVHRSPVMRRLVAKAQRVALRSVPVLIEGESGTGKELLARAIHHASPRRDGPFVAVNCGALPETLIEAELFGYERGAFTGAHKRHSGYFEQAHGSTLFLDEIGELPLQSQVKLLRVLQTGEVSRVGSTTPIQVDVRIIAATNRSLVQELQSGRFREDLFYRLAVAVLRLPPVREREGDVALLLDRLMGQVNEEAKEEPGYRARTLSAAARRTLMNHTWPGNVRELLNTLRRAALWSAGERIEERDVLESLHSVAVPGTGGGLLNRPIEQGIELRELIAELVRHYLERAYLVAEGNKSEAARLCGLASYQTFDNWVERYEVALPRVTKRRREQE